MSRNRKDVTGEGNKVSFEEEQETEWARTGCRIYKRTREEHENVNGEGRRTDINLGFLNK